VLPPTSSASWSGSLIWLAGTIVAAFLVSWFLTGRLGIRRTAYVAVLGIVTGALTIGYTAWSGVGTQFWTHNWLWGVAGAVLAGGFLTIISSRVRVAVPRTRRLAIRVVLWEAVVYGAAEGLLLSVLPVALTWQSLSAHGWTSGLAGVGAGVAALASSLAVIVVHHLGYAEFRSKKMRQPVIGCLVLCVAYQLSGNPIAAMGGHMILHIAMMRRGMELPPLDTTEQETRRSSLVAAG
jgi:hypothetical protein